MADGQLQRGLSAKWRLAGEHVIAGHSQGIDIGARIDLLALDLLGAHVQRRAHGQARLGQVCRGFGAGEDARQAEVGHLDLAPARQQDVLRLDIAMDDAQLAGPLQGRRRLPQDGERQGQIGRPLPVQVLAQVTPLDVLKRHVVQPGFLAGRMTLTATLRLSASCSAR